MLPFPALLVWLLSLGRGGLEMKLQELINKKHWTRETAAKKLGVSLRTLYFWLSSSSKKEPSGQSLKKICRVFKCSLSDLIT